MTGAVAGLATITPAAGFVNGYGAMALGATGSVLVYLAYNYVSRLRPFRNVDDTLGVIYTHGFAGLLGGLLVAVFADPKMLVYLGIGKGSGFSATGLTGPLGWTCGSTRGVVTSRPPRSMWAFG